MVLQVGLGLRCSYGSFGGFRVEVEGCPYDSLDIHRGGYTNCENLGDNAGA